MDEIYNGLNLVSDTLLQIITFYEVCFNSHRFRFFSDVSYDKIVRKWGFWRIKFRNSLMEEIKNQNYQWWQLF